MTITLRATKGSALTHSELDDNFTDLNGRLSGADITRSGIADYNDLATATTPISYTGGDTPVVLSNDGAGPATNLTYLPVGITAPFNTVSDEFDFSGMSLGDYMNVRLDVEIITTSPNQEISTALHLGTGGNVYSIPWILEHIKLVGTERLVVFNSIYMGDANTLGNPGQFKFESPDDATIKVNGWYMQIFLRGNV